MKFQIFLILLLCSSLLGAQNEGAQNEGAQDDLLRAKAEAHRLEAESLDREKNLRAASASHAQALRLWRELNELEEIASTLHALGKIHKNLGEFPQAIDFLQEAATLWRDLGRRGQEAQTGQLLGISLQRAGRFHEAAALYEDVIAAARELGEVNLEARALNSLGGIYQNLGEPARELDAFEKSLEILRSTDSEIGVGAVLNSLGAFHRRIGDTDAALQNYAQALAIFVRLDHRYWQARTLNNIGYAYLLSLGQSERARSYLLRALSLRREVGDQSGEIVTLLNLGRVFSALDEPGRAAAYLRKALDLSLATQNERHESIARKLLGKAYLENGDPTAARAPLETARERFQATGRRLPTAETSVLLARAHLAVGDLPRAIERAQEALALHRKVEDPLGEITALTTLARIRREQQRFEAEHELLKTALDVLESIHGRLVETGRKASFFASQRDVYELYVDLLIRLHRRSPDAGYDAAALEISEKGRSRSLLDLLIEAGADLGGSAISPDLRARLQAAEARLTAKTRRRLDLLEKESDANEILLAQQELDAAFTELENLRAEARAVDPRVGSVRPETLTSAQIRRFLDRDTVLLEYLLGEERSFLWWTTSNAIDVFELPPRREVEELAARVFTSLTATRRDRRAIQEGLRDLGTTLLGPIADRLQDQRLAIVADGVLHSIPFTALELPGRAGSALLTRHEIVHLPSASAAAVKRRTTADTHAKTIAVFADPIFTSEDPRLTAETPKGETPNDDESPVRFRGLEDLKRLPHTLREARAIADLVPENQRMLATGAEARRARMLGGDLSDYRILHFATHGFVDPRAPELSGLVLSTHDAEGRPIEGFVGLYDVSNLDLSADLVVLSGCRTALGKRVRGEGLVGLARGFMYAGASRVVGSLWQVRDRATAELMTQFYRAHLEEGLPPAAALRNAQLKLREQRRYRDPYYWAAFAVQGDWR